MVYCQSYSCRPEAVYTAYKHNSSESEQTTHSSKSAEPSGLHHVEADNITNIIPREFWKLNNDIYCQAIQLAGNKVVRENLHGKRKSEAFYLWPLFNHVTI